MQFSQVFVKAKKGIERAENYSIYTDLYLASKGITPAAGSMMVGVMYRTPGTDAIKKKGTAKNTVPKLVIYRDQPLPPP